jgi:Domain of unknown function (DUF3516)
VQSVPDEARDDEVEEIVAHLRQVVRGVDSSLLDEWESMMQPDAVRLARPGADVAPARPQDETEVLLRDPKRRAARVRNELHRLLAALAKKDWAEAERAIFVRDGAEPWTAERLAREMAPYFAAHASVDLTPRARRPDRTALTPDGPKAWRVQQQFGPSQRPLVGHAAVSAASLPQAPGGGGAAGHGDHQAADGDRQAPEGADAEWTLECIVDLAEHRPSDAPLIELIRIGT